MKKPEVSIIFLFLVSFFVLSALFMKFYHIGFVPGIGVTLVAIQPGFFDDFRQSSMMIATVSFFILVGLGVFVLKTKQKQYKKRLGLAFLGMFVAIFSHLLFYVTNLDYVYAEHPKVFMYTSSDGEYITNKEKYFGLVEKYWSNEKGFAKFKTLDDAIDALKLADKLNDKLLYILTFEDIGRFGYDKAFEKYQDKTFQVYFLNYIDPPLNYKENFYDNIKYFDSLIKNSEDNVIKEVTQRIKDKYSEYLTGNISEEEFFNFISDNVFSNSSLDNLEGVNYNLIY